MATACWIRAKDSGKRLGRVGLSGWTGKILLVDLSTGEHNVESPDPGLYAKWIGGKGLAGHYLRPHVTESWDSPDMPVIFMAGPLVGTAAPTSGRICLMSRSPLTGTIGDTSLGGRLGTDLKKAGLDGIVVTGRSDHPCGIEIDDDSVKIVDAQALSGKGTRETTGSLEGKGGVACIGPAAENGVLFANVMIDGHHAAGRNGLGAVFAAKNLKYVTIKGSGKVAVADAGALKKAREDIFRLIAATPVLLGENGITRYGTGALYDLMDSRRMMPTANFRRTWYEKAGSMNANAYSAKYGDKRTGCRGCHILCKRMGDDGTRLPEFETMSHFSALIENDDLDTVTRANTLCNELGMDTISAAATIACHAEVTGEPLTGDGVLALLRDIAACTGVGRELGQGSYRYAESKGRPELSMSVKKQELPGYDPRGAYGMALGYATSTRGGCHLRAYPISHEILRKPVATDRFTFAGKARIIKIAEDLNAVVDSLTACKFVFFGCSLEEYAKAYSAVVGEETSAQDLLAVGERIYYRERIMNSCNGFSAADDDLPSRFFEDGGTGGHGIDIAPIDREEFLAARSAYYRVRGLDADGMPVEEKMGELGL